MSVSIVAPSESRVEGALRRATDLLLSLQQPDGFWKAELETNVTMDAEDLLLRQFLGLPRAEETRLSAAWIRSQQRADGSWATHHGGPPELSTTIEAYTALRLAGDPADAEHLRRAREVVLDLGGIERSRVFTRIWLALFGEWSWDDLPALPPEVILLPAWFPLNVYDFACWARQTIVPLTVVAAHRPRRPLGFSVAELRTGHLVVEKHPLSTWPGRFQLLDRLLHRWERRPIGAVRRLALATATEWILRRQEADGSWGGIQPPWVYSLMALELMGYPLDHPAVRRGIEGLDGFAIVEDGVRRLEACQSPVWDTCLAMVALADAGVPPGHPALVRGAEWMLDEEIRVRGDWAVRRPDLEPGGWAFEFENDNYPDIDDTAEVILALRAAGHGEPERVEAAVQRAVHWTLGMQCRDGGFAAFDVDNTRRLCTELPFCDFGEVIDPPSADVTAHVLEMLALEGRAESSAARAACSWLLRAQEPDGSWFGRWGANHLYGTGACVPALIRAGVPREHAAIRRAVAWLESRQNEDGGFGEDLASYDDRSRAGRGASTPSQTAWALLALLAAATPAGASSTRAASGTGGSGSSGSGASGSGASGSDAIERAVAWLVERQRADGGWDEPEFTGTGFPGDFYIRYHQYALQFPVMALGRYVRADDR